MLEQIKKIVEEITDDANIIITEDTNFREDLDLDSLDMFEMIMTFEEEFHIKISTEEIKKLNTVGELIDYIEKEQENSK